jgi:hypothetical protein
MLRVSLLRWNAFDVHVHESQFWENTALPRLIGHGYPPIGPIKPGRWHMAMYGLYTSIAWTGRTTTRTLTHGHVWSIHFNCMDPQDNGREFFCPFASRICCVPCWHTSHMGDYAFPVLTGRNRLMRMIVFVMRTRTCAEGRRAESNRLDQYWCSCVQFEAH